MKNVLISAFIAFIITFGGALIAILTVTDVSNLSDVSQAGYLVAFLTGLIAAAKAYKDRMAKPPKIKKNKQSGFFSLPLMAHLGIISLLVVIWLPACSTIDKVKDAEPWKPFQDCVTAIIPNNNTIAACIKGVTMLAHLADAATESGLISTDKQMDILSRLYSVAKLLKIMRQYETISSAGDELQVVKQNLITIKAQIPVAAG